MRGAVILLIAATAGCGLSRDGLSRDGSPASPARYAEGRALAEQAQEHFHEGLRLHRGGQSGEDSFRKAADAWERVAALGFSSAALMRNLGNAHFLSGSPAHALLAFHHGLQLDPNDDTMRSNLVYVRAQVRYPFGDRGQPPAENWPPWLHRPSIRELLFLALLSWLAAWLVLTRWRMRPRQSLVVQAGVLLLTSATLVFAAWRVHARDEDSHRFPLVVIAEDRTPLLKGNGPSYPAHPELPYLSRGMEARLVTERGDYLQIRFASGEVGWVDRDAALVEAGL